MSSRDAAKKRAGSTTDDATEGRSGRRNSLASRRAARRHPTAGAAPTQGDDDGLRRRHRGQRAARRGARRLRRDADRPTPRRAGPSPSSSSSTARAPSSATTASTSWSSASTPADVPVDVWVGPVGQPGHRRRHRRCSRPPAPSACAGGSRVEITPVLLGDGTLDGEAAVGDKVSAGEAVDLGLVDNVAPTIGVFVYGEQPGEGLPGAESGDRRRAAPARHADPLRPAPARRPAPAHRGQPTGGLPPLRHRPGPHRLRALHRRASAWPAWSGAGCLDPRLLRPGRAAHQPRRRRPAPVRHVRLRHRRADRRAPGVERHRHRVASPSGSVLLYDGLSLSWITLLVAIGGMALAMIGGMPAMVRTRFSTPTIGREWMVGEVGTARGPGRPGRRRHRPRRPVAGPHQPGHPDRGRGSRCGSCPSTGCCSRSSRSTGRPRTTATGAERPDPIDRDLRGVAAPAMHVNTEPRMRAGERPLTWECSRS